MGVSKNQGPKMAAPPAQVVATSNLAPEDLYSSGINREVFQPFIDSILDHCDPVRLTVARPDMGRSTLLKGLLIYLDLGPNMECMRSNDSPSSSRKGWWRGWGSPRLQMDWDSRISDFVLNGPQPVRYCSRNASWYGQP